MKKRKVLGLITLLIGIIFFFYPFFSISIDDYIESKKLKTFIENEIKESENQIENKKLEEKDKGKENVKDDKLVEKNISKNESDEKIGTVFIPKLKQSFDLYNNADMEKISKGVAITKESDKPLSGEGSRTVLAGHRGYYNKRMFKDIDNLNKGDDIFLKYNGSVVRYTVSDMETIKDNEKEKLNPIENREVLTLLTCGSATDSSHRFLVNCDKNDYDIYVDKENSSLDNEDSSKNINEDNKIDRNRINKNREKNIQNIKNIKEPENIKIKKMFFKLMSILGMVLIAMVIFKIVKISRT